MARQANRERLEAIAEVVRKNPGCKPSFIAKVLVLGLHRSAITRAFPALEEGMLLVEDDKGGLFYFGRRR
jgi:hypothetical protein